MSEEKVANPLGGERFGAWDKDYTFGEAVVDDDEDGIESFGCRKIGNEIHRTLRKGTGFRTSFDRE
jgi:hypothetical protein